MPTNYWLKFGNTPLGYNGSGVQFTHVEQPGQLTVGVSLSGSDYDPTKAFAFVVTFGRAISYSVNGTPVSSPTNTYNGSLASGGSVVLSDVPYGVTYAVTENALPSSDVTAGYSTGSVTNGSGTMTDGGSVNVTANYAYSIPRSNVLVLQNKANSATTFTFRYGSQGATTPFEDKDVGYMVNGVQYTSGGTSFSVSVPANSSVNLEVIDAGAAGPSADAFCYLRVYGSADGTTRIYGDGEQYPWGSVSASSSQFGTILLFNYAWFYDSSRTLPVARIER